MKNKTIYIAVGISVLVVGFLLLRRRNKTQSSSMDSKSTIATPSVDKTKSFSTWTEKNVQSKIAPYFSNTISVDKPRFDKIVALAQSLVGKPIQRDTDQLAGELETNYEGVSQKLFAPTTNQQMSYASQMAKKDRIAIFQDMTLDSVTKAILLQLGGA